MNPFKNFKSKEPDEHLLFYLPDIDGATKVMLRHDGEHPELRRIGYRFGDEAVVLDLCLCDFLFCPSDQRIRSCRLLEAELLKKVRARAEK